MPQHPVIMGMVKPPAAGGGIITDDLVLHLDAGDSGSYSGSGSTWTDLSASGNDFTLVGAPTYTTTDGGEFEFNGTDEYATGTDTDFPTGAAVGTIQMWLTVESGASGWEAAFAYGTADTLQARGCAFSFAGNLAAAAYGAEVEAASAPTTGQWYNVAFVYDGTDIELFVDGSSEGTSTQTLNTVSNVTYVGRQVNDGEYWTGKVSQILVYDVALTSTQITANYDATSARYA